MATRDLRLASELVRRLTTRVPLTSPLRDFEERLMATHPIDGVLVPLVTRLFDPGLDPRWLEPLWPSTQLVIVTVATGLGSDGWLRRRLVSRLRRFRTELPPVRPSRSGPSRLRTPFAAFHYYMWRRASTGQPTP
jgi:hypothetical protein